MVRERSAIANETPYRRHLRQIIMTMRKGELLDTHQQPIQAFTPAWMAQHIGRKVTKGFREAMQQFEHEGLIFPYSYYTENGGLAKAYSVLEQQPSTDDYHKPF